MQKNCNTNQVYTFLFLSAILLLGATTLLRIMEALSRTA